MVETMSGVSSPETKMNSKPTKRKMSTSDSDCSPNKKQNDEAFTEIDFKSMLRDSNTTFIALEKFIAESTRWPHETSYDIVEQYCRASPECSEIVQLLQKRDRKPKEIALIMTSLEKILIRIADDLKKFKLIGMNVVKQLLTTHMSTFYFLLAMRNKSGHIKAALKLLSAMVIQGETAAKDVQLQFDFQNNILIPLLNRRDRKDVQDVRTCCLHFMMSFLMTGDNDMIKNLLETKGFLNAIFPGLVTDKYIALQLVLPTLTEKIVQNQRIPKTTKLHLFNEHALKGLLQLYRWCGPGNSYPGEHKQQKTSFDPDAEGDIDPLLKEQRQDVQEMVHQLLLELCCSLKHGIIFRDKTCATSGKNLNKALTQMLTSLQKPYLDPLQTELVCRTLKVCPDQIHWYLPTLKNSLSPRPSKVWTKCMDFIYQIYMNQDEVSVSMVVKLSLTVPKMMAVVMNLLFPPKDVWTVIVSAIKKESIVIQHPGVKLGLVVMKRIVAALDDCNRNIEILPEGFTTMLRDNIIKTLPNLNVIYNCWQAAFKSKEVPETYPDLPHISLPDHLKLLLQMLCFYQDVLPQLFTEHHIDYKSLLEGVRAVRQHVDSADKSLSMLQFYLVKLLVEADVRRFNWTKENVEGHTTLYLLLEMVVLTQNDKYINPIIRHLLHKLFIRTGYFESAESEMTWWIGNLTNIEDPLPVIRFLDQSFVSLFRSPYIFLDKIQEASAAAASLDTGDSAEKGTKSGSTDALLTKILSTADVDLLEDDFPASDKHSNHTLTSTTHTSQSFSPLIPAVLSTLEMLESPGTNVKEYVQMTLNSVLHHLTNPVPLCILLKTHSCYKMFPQLHPSIERWNPGKKLKKMKKSLCKSTGEQHDYTTDWKTLSELLQFSFEQRNELKFRNEITEKTKMVFVNEALDAMKQILLYLRTAVLEYLQDVSMTTDVIQFYAELLVILIDAITKSADTPQFARQHSDEILSDFSMFDIEEPSKYDILREMFILFFSHDMIKKYFICETIDSSKVQETSHVISSLVAEVVSRIPDSLNLSKYLDIFAERISSWIHKSAQLTNETFLGVIQGFMELVDSETLDKLSSLLLSSDFMQKLLKQQHDQEAEIQLMMMSLSKLSSGTRLSQHSLSLEAVTKLTAMAVTSANQQLLQLVGSIFHKAPVYAMALDQHTFVQLLQLQTTASDDLVILLLHDNPFCHTWFMEWLEKRKHTQKKRTRWQNINYLVSYLQGCTDLTECQNLYKTYWPELCAWLINKENNPASDDQMFNMIYQMVQISTETADLSSLVRNLTEVRPTGEINVINLQHQITVLKLILEKLGQSADTVCLSSLAEAAVQFGVSLFVSLMKEKKTEAEDLIRLLINSLLAWTKCLESEVNLDDTWKEFITLGLRKHYTNCEYLSLVCQLLPLIYKDHEDIKEKTANQPGLTVKEIYSMVLAHSEFLSVMLSEQSPQKAALVDLLVILTDLHPGCCQTSHISVLLGAYGATLSITDQKLLLLLYKYEQCGCNFSSYRPYMWGPQAIEHHRLRKNLGPSLHKSPTMEQIIDLLDREKLTKSALKFPLMRRAQIEVQDATILRSELDLYDPCFLLPLFSHLLAVENLVNCKKFVEHGCLSYLLVSLSSHNETLRALAYHGLARYHNHLEARTKFRHRYQILYLLNTIRNTVETPNMKLPCIITTFLARAAQIMLNPEDHMYQVVNSFLLLKPVLDVRHVPEFYVLFNSATLEHKLERSWILTLLQDGLRETHDYHIYERKKVFRLILSFYEAAIGDQYTQMQILKLIEIGCGIRSVASNLLKNHGLLQWLGIAIQSGADDPPKASQLIKILHTLWSVLLGSTGSPKDSTCQTSLETKSVDDGKMEQMKDWHLPVALINQMLLVLLDLLKHLSNVTSETFLKFIECLLSVCCHAKKIESLLGSSSANSVMSIQLSQRHIVILLNHWSLLTSDQALRMETEKVLKDKKYFKEATPSSKKLTTKRKQQKSTVDSQKPVMQDDLRESCLEKLLSLIPFCKTKQGHNLDVREAKHCEELQAQTVSATLLLLRWSLDTLRSRLSSHVAVVEKIISWFWQLLETDPHLQNQLLSENTEILRHFIASYDCVLSCLASNLRGDKGDVEGLLHNLNRIHLLLLQRLSSTDCCLKEKGTKLLRERLATDVYKQLLDKLSELILNDRMNQNSQHLAMAIILFVVLGGANTKQARLLLDTS